MKNKNLYKSIVDIWILTIDLLHDETGKQKQNNAIIWTWKRPDCFTKNETTTKVK